MLAHGPPVPPGPFVTPGSLPWPAAVAAMAATVIVAAVACRASASWLPRLRARRFRRPGTARRRHRRAVRAAYVDRLAALFRSELGDRRDWPS